MPFRARCMFCKHGVRVPDNAVGASVKCPKCASFFTIVPVEDDEPTSSRPTPQATDFTASAPMATAVATMPSSPPSRCKERPKKKLSKESYLTLGYAPSRSGRCATSRPTRTPGRRASTSGPGRS